MFFLFLKKDHLNYLIIGKPIFVYHRKSSYFQHSTIQIYLFTFPITKIKKKTLFTINKKKKREKRPLRKYPRSKLLRSNEWIFSNIYNYRYSSSRFISMHPSTIDCIHPPFQPSQLFIVGRSISDGRNVS